MPPSAAACLIKSNVQLLVIKNKSENGWNVPTHKQLLSTSAQCTAHKAAWKTTGLNVEVGKLLYTGSNQTQYFECRLTDEPTKQLQKFTVPEWAQRKTASISLVDPFETQYSQWSEEIDLVALREAYIQLK